MGNFANVMSHPAGEGTAIGSLQTLKELGIAAIDALAEITGFKSIADGIKNVVALRRLLMTTLAVQHDREAGHILGLQFGGKRRPDHSRSRRR